MLRVYIVEGKRNFRKAKNRFCMYICVCIIIKDNRRSIGLIKAVYHVIQHRSSSYFNVFVFKQIGPGG